MVVLIAPGRVGLGGCVPHPGEPNLFEMAWSARHRLIGFVASGMSSDAGEVLAAQNHARRR
jgi:hypothetical protein